MKNKDIRKQARKTIEKNYFTLVFVCLIMMIFAGSYATTFNGIKNILRDDSIAESIKLETEVDSLNSSNLDITSSVLKTIFKTDNVDDIYVEETVTAGLFRTIFDGVTHLEQFLFRIVKGVLDVFVNTNKTILLVILVLLFQLFFRVFVSKPLKVCQARVFMESRLYYKTPFKRMMAFTNFKDYFRAVRTIFLVDLFQMLWDLTIIGGIIKRYSYRLVPMIMAENPKVKPFEAINLSKNMMRGNKWQLFKMDLSFTLYMIMDIATYGLLGVLVFNPYYAATIVEFYSFVKEKYIDNKCERYELLNDKYLLENKKDLECYPGVTRKEKKKMEEMFNYYQKYTTSSLILLFFTFAFIGWLWEVLLYVYKDGIFINRGVLHGPWLPIYGVGGVLILFLLFLPKKFKKFMDNPVLTFVIVVILCGIIEYSTSWYLEYTQGLRWWDYTGNFLNLNGRICFEGLTFFGIGGCLCLYIVAPHMQAIFAKMKPRFRVALCVVLSIIFLLDVAYSYNNPNVGAGITDDGSHNQIIEETLKEAN
ncbi:MAG: DUF975 family protein [Clostridia bacterium]|nr:DUF975 family protein [Clostridia bacterium]